MRAAIYTRISADDGGALGVSRQREDCEREATRRGWSVSHVYTDNDVSATRSKVRPQYARMIADIEAGLLDALVVWDVDRLTRTPRELEDIIDLADRTGLALASVGGEIDLGTPQGRLTARVKGSVARAEVEQLGRRVRRANDARAARGHAHAQVGFGFRRVDGRAVEDPSEGALIREAADRVLAGESLRGVCANFNARGIATPGRSGNWNTTTMKQLLLRPSVAGLRQHRGVVVGELDGDSIISLETRDRLLATLNDPSRRANFSGRTPKYLLGGIARCGKCGAAVRRLMPWESKTGASRTAAAYACAECHGVRRLQAPVDALVEEVLLRRLERPDAAGLFARRGDAAVAREARDAVAVIDARLATAADQFADGVLTGEQLRRITEKLRQERESAETRLQRALPAALPRDMMGAKARERWAQIDVTAKRSVIADLMRVTIMPARRGAEFDPEDIRIEWVPEGT